MKRIFKVVLMLAVLAFPVAVLAAPEVKGCEGPAELCAQVKDLNQKLAELEDAKANGNKDVSAAKEEEKRKSDERMAKVIAMAGIMAVVLKMLLSALSSWKDYFKTDRGKAWLKIITVVVGLAAFVAGNVGMGIPFWQSLILAGGGPGAMAVHSITQLIPVLMGKKKLPESNPPPPPDKPEQTAPEAPPPGQA